MRLRSHAHIRIAFILAFVFLFLASTKIGQGQLPNIDIGTRTKIAVEPISNPPTQIRTIQNESRENDSTTLGKPEPKQSRIEEQVAIFIIGSSIANLRAGPSQKEAVVLVATRGEQYAITGKSPDLGWVEVCCVHGSKAWIASQLGLIYGSLEQAPIKSQIMPLSPSTSLPSSK